MDSMRYICLNRMALPCFCRQYSSASTAGASDTSSESVNTGDVHRSSTGNSDELPPSNGDKGDIWREKLLDVALQYVSIHGWSMTSVEKAAEELRLSPSVTGLFKNGAAELVLHFERRSNQRLVKLISEWIDDESHNGQR